MQKWQQRRLRVLTLQLALVFDMELDAAERVPQTLGSMEEFRAGSHFQGHGIHVVGLHGVEAGAACPLVTLALASREIDGIFGNVEARHDSTGACVDNERVCHIWLDLQSALTTLRH